MWELSQEVEPIELVSGMGSDGHEYVIRSIPFTYDKVEALWKKFSSFNIFSDDGTQTFEQFMARVTQSPLWFECVDLTEDGKQVGVVHVDALLPSLNERMFLCAQFHAYAWDSVALPRRELLKQAIKELFSRLRLHRLEARVPLNHGGAIRNLKLLGFRDEGVMREGVRFGGKWYGVLVLSMLESEVQDG